MVAIITGAFLYDTLFTRPAWGGKAITIQLVPGWRAGVGVCRSMKTNRLLWSSPPPLESRPSHAFCRSPSQCP